MGKSAKLQTSSENHTTDGDFSGKDGSEDTHISDSKTESNSSSGSRTESNQSSDSTTTGLSAIIRVLSDSLVRTELAELEMIKAREAARWEAEKRRLEMELELTRLVLQTHLQMTESLLVAEEKIRKRKRSEVEEHESCASSPTTRVMSLAFLSLLQLNLILWNSLT